MKKCSFISKIVSMLRFTLGYFIGGTSIDDNDEETQAYQCFNDFKLIAENIDDEFNAKTINLEEYKVKYLNLHKMVTVFRINLLNYIVGNDCIKHLHRDVFKYEIELETYIEKIQYEENTIIMSANTIVNENERPFTSNCKIYDYLNLDRYISSNIFENTILERYISSSLVGRVYTNSGGYQYKIISIDKNKATIKFLHNDMTRTVSRSSINDYSPRSDANKTNENKGGFWKFMNGKVVVGGNA